MQIRKINMLLKFTRSHGLLNLLMLGSYILHFQDRTSAVDLVSTLGVTQCDPPPLWKILATPLSLIDFSVMSCIKVAQSIYSYCRIKLLSHTRNKGRLLLVGLMRQHFCFYKIAMENVC